MKLSGFVTLALSGAAAAMLAGCVGSQPSIGAEGMAQNAVVRQSRAAPACAGSTLRAVRCAVLIQAGVHQNMPVGWSPANLQSAYNLPSSQKGSGQIVAVVDAYDNPDVASDLSEYRSEFDLPAANFTKYNQRGKQGGYPPGNPAWGVETDLAVEMVSASCPNCTIYLVEADSAAAIDLQTAEAEAVALGAHIVSNGWACSGSGCIDQTYFDTKGVTYLGSAGDDVSGTGTYPADFDSVVAIGGTVLSPKAAPQGGRNRGWTEAVLDASLGGCIAADSKPRWQYLKSCAYRAANDVSAVAENVAEYDSYYEMGWINVEGTSIASPLLAGVFGLAGNASQQDGGRTFWQKAHHKYLYRVNCGSSCIGRRYSYGGGWGSPDGVEAF